MLTGSGWNPPTFQQISSGKWLNTVRNFFGNNLFLLLCLVALLLTNHFPFPLSTYLYCKFMCTVKTQHLQLVYVTTVASRIQSSFDHIFHIFLAGIEMGASHCNLFSPHLCQQDPPITLPLCNATVPLGQDSGPTSLLQIQLRLCFKNRPKVKLTNQGHAKLRDLGNQHNPNIIVPQLQGYRTEPQVLMVCVGSRNQTRVSSFWSCNATTKLNPHT